MLLLFDFILRVFVLLAGYCPGVLLGCLSTALFVRSVCSMPLSCSQAALPSGTWVDFGVSTGEGCRGGRAILSLCVSTLSTCRNSCVHVMVSSLASWKPVLLSSGASNNHTLVSNPFLPDSGPVAGYCTQGKQATLELHWKPGSCLFIITMLFHVLICSLKSTLRTASNCLFYGSK